MFCSNCGNQIDSGVSFCPSCGYAVNQQHNITASKTTGESKNEKMAMTTRGTAGKYQTVKIIIHVIYFIITFAVCMIFIFQVEDMKETYIDEYSFFADKSKIETMETYVKFFYFMIIFLAVDAFLNIRGVRARGNTYLDLYPTRIEGRSAKWFISDTFIVLMTNVVNISFRRGCLKIDVMGTNYKIWTDKDTAAKVISYYKQHKV